jgi:hypothetical protein
MRIKIAIVSLLAVVALLATGCGLAQGLMGGNSSTVSSLWADVPPLPAATKANIDIPLPVNFIIQTFMTAANADDSSDVKLEKFDFIAYNTADSPQQVSEFYSSERMRGAGWNAEDTPGCTSTGDAAGSAGFCVFGKTAAGGAHTVLMIVPVRDDTTNQTQVFYIRFDATQRPQ